MGKPPRTLIALRVSPAAVKHIDSLADREGITRSEMIRRMLSYAVKHMPKGWKG